MCVSGYAYTSKPSAELLVRVATDARVGSGYLGRGQGQGSWSGPDSGSGCELLPEAIALIVGKLSTRVRVDAFSLPGA